MSERGVAGGVAATRKWFREFLDKQRREWKRVQRRPSHGDRRYPLFGAVIPDGEFKGDYAVWVSEGGWIGRKWITTKAFEQAVDRWVKRAYQVSGEAFEEQLAEQGGGIQCGGCCYFAAFDGDYGLCVNAKSPMDGRVTFEHAGCTSHSNIEAGLYTSEGEHRDDVARSAAHHKEPGVG